MSIKSNIEKIKDEIASICNDCGRNPQEVNLMAVTKTVDVDAVFEAIDAGITDVGENKPQELARKYEVIGVTNRYYPTMIRPGMQENAWMLAQTNFRGRKVVSFFCYL